MKNFLKSLRATLGQIGHAVAVLVGRSKAMAMKILDKINPRYRSSACTGFIVAAASLLLAAVTGVHIIAGFMVAILAVLATAGVVERDEPKGCVLSVLVGGGVYLLGVLMVLVW